jgi:hypothetical protein
MEFMIGWTVIIFGEHEYPEPVQASRSMVEIQKCWLFDQTETGEAMLY